MENHEITFVQCVEVYIYVKEVVKARVREKQEEEEEERKADGRNTKHLLSSASPGN